jgi:two-component system sensor histidine kinase KdpD
MSFAVTMQSAFTRRVADYGAAVVACCLTAAVAFPLRNHLDLPDIVMLFLLAVFLVATFLGRGPAVVASFLSVALFDYYFDTPHHFLFFGDAEHLLTFAIMLAVGLVTAQLVSRAAARTDDARARERETRQLYEAARDIAGAHDVTQILEAAQHYLSNRGLGGNLLVAGDDDRLVDHPGGHHVLGIAESGCAEAACRGSEFVAADPRDLAGAAIACFPLRAATRVRGVLAVTPLDDHTRLADEQYKAVEALASLAALALERLHYAENAQRAEIMVADERLRSSVLTSLSHDLRTPLTTLVGLADTLAERRATLPADAAETAGIIRDQAQAMHKLLSDLLDMARLKSASAPLRREWQPFEDVVGSSLRLAENVAPDRHVTIDLAPDLPLIFFDAVLIERVLCNLLDNAFKYARPGARISLAARQSSAHLEVSVCNDGSEFPAGRIEPMFDLFVRGANESCIPGAGLGLAICKAIVEAHGGSIRAENRAGGACVRFTLPCLTPPPVAIEDEP